MFTYRYKEYGSHNKNVIFLLTGWHSTISRFTIVSRILAYHGFHCITYEYDGSVLSPDVAETKKNITTVVRGIIDRIDNLPKSKQKNISIFGTSLGSMIGIIAANKSPYVSTVILNLTGAILADTVWSWDKCMTGFKETLLKNDMTLLMLREKWSSLAPIHNLDTLKRKKVLLYLARRDEIIPNAQGLLLYKEMKKLGIRCTVSENLYFGHFGSGLLNVLNYPLYINYIRSKENAL